MRIRALVYAMASFGTIHAAEVLVSDSKQAWQITGNSALPSSLKLPYPEMAVVASNMVFIGYADTSGKYRIRVIRDGKVSNFAETDCFPDHEQVGRLPQMMADSGGVVICSVSRDISPTGHTIDVISLGADGKPKLGAVKIAVPRQRPFPKSKYYVFDAAIPMDPARNSYLVVGEFREVYLSHGLIPVVPDPEGYRKNVAITLSWGQLPSLKRIESKGRFYVSTADYTVLSNGVARCAWIRCSGPPFSNERTEDVCYSILQSDGWSNPEVIVSQRGQNGTSFEDVAVRGTKTETLVVWARDRDGFYSVTVTNGKISPPLRLGVWQDYDSNWAEGVAMMRGSSCCDVFADVKGDMLVVWALNKREKSAEFGIEHRIILRWRRNGVWMPEVTLNIGGGLVRSPKVTADCYGRVHIAYLKQVDSQQFGCFYQSSSKEELHSPR